MRKISQIGRFHIKIRFPTSEQLGAQYRAWSCAVGPARPLRSLWLLPLPISTRVGTPCRRVFCRLVTWAGLGAPPRRGPVPLPSPCGLQVLAQRRQRSTEGTPLLHLVLTVVVQTRDAYFLLVRTGGSCPRAGQLRLSLKLCLPIMETCCETPGGFPLSTNGSKGKIIRIRDIESTISK